MAWNYYKKGQSKYKAQKTEYNGVIYDSKKEAQRASELSIMEKLGIISHVQRQVKFVLVPAQREPDIIGAKGGIKKGKVIERELSYIADFVYIDEQSGQTIVEDTKGFRTPEYKIKRKLMLYFHNIRIREV